MKSGFVLLSRDTELIALSLQAAAQVSIEIRLLEDYPIISESEYLIADPKALIDQPQLRPDILVSRDLTESTWQFAANYSPAQLIELPDAINWFQSWLTNQQITKSKVMTFKSATAGAGSSCLAVAVGFLASYNQDVVLVDLDNSRSSLTMLTTISTKDSVSWQQLMNLTGLPAASALFSGLPKLNKLRLLTFDKPTTLLNQSFVENVITLLQEQAQLVIVDLGPNNSVALRQSEQFLVAPGNLLGLAKIKQSVVSESLLLRLMPKTGLTKSDVSDYLAPIKLRSYQSETRLQLDIADGVIPGERKKSELRRIARELLVSNDS